MDTDTNVHCNGSVNAGLPYDRQHLATLSNLGEYWMMDEPAVEKKTPKRKPLSCYSNYDLH